MYARRIKCRYRRWGSKFQQPKDLSLPNCPEHASSQFLSSTLVTRNHSSHNGLIRRHVLDSITSRGIGGCSTYCDLYVRLSLCSKSSQLRVYSSEGDGRNASEDKLTPIKDRSSSDEGNTRQENVNEDVRHFDVHAWLGEQDQKEWLANEKLAIESKMRESPFLTRREKFKTEFLRRIVPWENISVSWETFPYHIQYLLLAHIFSHYYFESLVYNTCR